MMLYCVVFSVMLIGTGALVHFIAPKVGPNIWLGLRIGYTFTDRETWGRVNSYLGELLIIFGFALFLLSLFLEGIALFIACMIAVVAPVILSYKEAVKLRVSAGFEAGEEGKKVIRIKPQKVSKIYFIMPFLLLSIMLFICVLAYPLLPEQVAIHFDSSGNPDGWSDKLSAILIFPTIGAIFAFIPILLVALSKRYSMLFYRGELKTGESASLERACGAMFFVVVIMLFAQIYAILRALYGTGIWVLYLMISVSALFLWIAFRYHRGGMKMLEKIQIIAVVCILLISTSTTAYSSAESIEEKALRFVELLGDGEFDIAFDMCNETLADALSSPEGLKSLWSQIAPGDLVAIEETRSEILQGYRAVIVTCRFTKGSLNLRIVFDEDDEIGGIFLAPPEVDFEAISRSTVDLLSRGEFEEVTKLSGEGLNLSARKLRRDWYSLMLKAGRYKDITKVKIMPLGNIAQSTVSCNFTRYSVNIFLSFDAYGKLTGLTFFHYPPPDYADLNSFTEIECTVDSLPATLTLPEGEGPFPGVVLVHGSGANDRDETLGPNKVFRDIAWGLASRGIAVLRYDKYSYVHNTMPENITGRDLLVSNALSAVEFLKENADVGKVFVIGHSEGGMLAPLIAERGKDLVDGIIILAGPTKNIPAALLGQYSYLFIRNDGIIDEREAAVIDHYKQELERFEDPAVGDDEIVMEMKKSYWKYDPVKTAKMLTQPILVLQGGMDYQVTLEDFEGWISGLAGKENVSFKIYPELFHCFMQGSLDPADYEKAGHVEEEVIEDIAKWINDHQ